MLTDHPARSRLDGENVLWLTTVRPDGRPQSSPVWFLVENGEILVYSLPSQRIRNIADNPHVAVHLNSDEWASRVFTMEGRARLDDDAPPADEHDAFVKKYRQRMSSYGWSPSYFAEHYPYALRIEIDRIRD